MAREAHDRERDLTQCKDEDQGLGRSSPENAVGFENKTCCKIYTRRWKRRHGHGPLLPLVAEELEPTCEEEEEPVKKNGGISVIRVYTRRAKTQWSLEEVDAMLDAVETCVLTEADWVYSANKWDVVLNYMQQNSVSNHMSAYMVMKKFRHIYGAYKHLKAWGTHRDPQFLANLVSDAQAAILPGGISPEVYKRMEAFCASTSILNAVRTLTDDVSCRTEDAMEIHERENHHLHDSHNGYLITRVGGDDNDLTQNAMQHGGSNCHHHDQFSEGNEHIYGYVGSSDSEHYDYTTSYHIGCGLSPTLKVQSRHLNKHVYATKGMHKFKQVQPEKPPKMSKCGTITGLLLTNNVDIADSFEESFEYGNDHITQVYCKSDTTAQNVPEGRVKDNHDEAMIGIHARSAPKLSACYYRRLKKPRHTHLESSDLDCRGGLNNSGAKPCAHVCVDEKDYLTLGCLLDSLGKHVSEIIEAVKAYKENTYSSL